MGYSTVSYGDVEPVADGMHFLRDPLDAEAVGVTILDCDPAWSGQPHDHADDGHEEVYFLIEGDASVEIEDRTVDLDPGDAVRIDPGDTRQLRIGDASSRLVLVGADR